MSSRYDLAVIGAGSAGFWVAIAAAELGARVALIGHGTIGGTCVNISCMPSKNLIRATEALYHANNAARFDGMRARDCVEDWRAVIRGTAHGRTVGARVGPQRQELLRLIR